MDKDKIKTKFGSVRRYCKLRGWKYSTVTKIKCGAIKGYGKVSAGIISRMRRDGVL